MSTKTSYRINTNRFIKIFPIGLLGFFLPSLMALSSPAATDDDARPSPLGGSPSEVTFPLQSLREVQMFWLEPSIGLTSGHWRSATSVPATESDLRAPSSRSWKGLEIGGKILTDSNLHRSFLLGFDLREMLAWDPSLTTDLRIGLHAMLRTDQLSKHRNLSRLLPDLGVTWFFGDLFRPISRGMQFSGNSWAVALSKQLPTARWGLEYGWGDEQEGGGFIETGVQGFHTLHWTRWMAFVALPLAVEY